MPSPLPKALRAFLARQEAPTTSGLWSYEAGRLSWSTLLVAEWVPEGPQLLHLTSQFPRPVRVAQSRLKERLEAAGTPTSRLETEATSPWTVGAIGAVLLEGDK